MAVLAQLPNLPADDVPDGADEHANVEHHHFGAKRDYAFPPKQHFELGEALGQMDFETAAKLSGARFVVLQKGLARMERALGQFMLDLHTQEHGYTEVSPPLLVRDDAMFGTAQLPKFADDQFSTSSRFDDEGTDQDPLFKFTKKMHWEPVTVSGPDYIEYRRTVNGIDITGLTDAERERGFKNSDKT